MDTERRYWQFVVSPPGGGEPYRFRLSLTVMRLLGVLAVVAVAVLVTGAAIYTRVLREAGRTKQLAAEVHRLRADNEKIVALARDLDEVRAREKKVLELLGVSDGAVFDRGPGDDGYESAPVSAAPAASQDDYVPSVWPVLGEVSRAFTPVLSHRHEGVDIAGRTGAPVQAAGSGTVTFAGPDSVFGNLVRIDHGNGYVTAYGHNSRLEVTKGQAVARGQVIAYVGSTGISSAPHLHFEVRRNGQSLDPMTLLGPADSLEKRHR